MWSAQVPISLFHKSKTQLSEAQLLLIMKSSEIGGSQFQEHRVQFTYDASQQMVDSEVSVKLIYINITAYNSKTWPTTTHTHIHTPV